MRLWQSVVMAGILGLFAVNVARSAAQSEAAPAGQRPLAEAAGCRAAHVAATRGSVPGETRA